MEAKADQFIQEQWKSRLVSIRITRKQDQVLTLDVAELAQTVDPALMVRCSAGLVLHPDLSDPRKALRPMAKARL
jgi:hypothetical protein